MSEKNLTNEQVEMINHDNQGNVIPAFPVSEQTKKDHRKTSVAYSTLAIILHVLSFVPIFAITLVLAIHCYNLMPYYGFWPFVGTILAGVFGLVFMAIALTIARKNSKHSIRNQTVKIAIAFVCLTSVFGILMTYAFPDVISMATQHTIRVEDLYYNGEKQAETNAKLERDFIMYNLLAGNLGHEYSFYDLGKPIKSEINAILGYENEDIDERVNEYLNYSVEDIQIILDQMQTKAPRKYELYSFIYKSYILPNFDYAFNVGVGRQAIALAITDYEYENAHYEDLLKEGFKNKRIKQLFDDRFDSFNQDGYQAFDDPLLLLAQMAGRMTVPAVLHLILDDNWTYTQPILDDNGDVIGYDEENSFLYEMYDPEARDAFEDNGGEYDRGPENAKYGVNEDGWFIYEDGTVKRPIKWLVLDMLGDPMAVASVDLNSSIGNIVQLVLGMFPDLVGALGDFLTEDLSKVINYATGGASLSIGLYLTDDNALNIEIIPSNVKYGMLGYMQASWVQSDNLLMAVINVMGLRNWLCIFGAIGVVLVIAGGVCREMGRKTRERTSVSRDRILRAQAAGDTDVSVADVPQTDAPEGEPAPEVETAPVGDGSQEANDEVQAPQAEDAQADVNVDEASDKQ